jgi:hypothetical protein
VSLFVAVVVGVGPEDDEAAVDGEGLQFDGKSGAFFMREGGADFGPVLSGISVAFEFVDDEIVDRNSRSGPLWIHCAAQSMLRASPG